MTDKYITQYTEETSPASTDAVLLDKGSGVYKYAQLSVLLSKINFTTSGKIETTSTASDSIKTGGGATIAKRVIIDDTTEATTTTDGSFATKGGGSFANNVVVGGDIYTTAWTDWTPTITYDGAGGTVPQYTYTQAKYKKIGKTVYYTVSFVGDGGNEGSGTEALLIAPPVAISTAYDANARPSIGFGQYRNNAVLDTVCAVLRSSKIALVKTASQGLLTFNDQDNANRVLRFSGQYEAQ